jgi:hypothetical protein
LSEIVKSRHCTGVGGQLQSPAALPPRWTGPWAGSRAGLGVVIQLETKLYSPKSSRLDHNWMSLLTWLGNSTVPLKHQWIVFLKIVTEKVLCAEAPTMRAIPTPTMGPTLPRCQDSSHSVNCIPLACNRNKGEHITHDSLDTHALLQVNEHDVTPVASQKQRGH